MKMYNLVVILYRQIDDLSLSDDPIRIPNIVSVIIKLFYNETAIRFFSDSQNHNENYASPKTSMPAVSAPLKIRFPVLPSLSFLLPS